MREWATLVLVSYAIGNCAAMLARHWESARRDWQTVVLLLLATAGLFLLPGLLTAAFRTTL